MTDLQDWSPLKGAVLGSHGMSLKNRVVLYEVTEVFYQATKNVHAIFFFVKQPRMYRHTHMQLGECDLLIDSLDILYSKLHKLPIF